MICAWCYGQLAETDRITDRHGSDVHLDCAMTEIGLGVRRTDAEHMRYLGMTDDEIAGELGDTNDPEYQRFMRAMGGK